MATKSDVNPALLSKLSLDSVGEWQATASSIHNTLLEGSQASTAAVLLLLAPYLRTPIVWQRRGKPLELPTGACGALVLEEVGALSGEEQARLRVWLEQSNHHCQVISTTVDSLFMQVTAGLFDEVLYYRLNVMVLSVGLKADAVPERRGSRPYETQRGERGLTSVMELNPREGVPGRSSPSSRQEGQSERRHLFAVADEQDVSD